MIALAVAAAPPVPALAAAGPSASKSSNIKEVRRLYREGRARYETLDYAGAVELWTKAYAMVEPIPENREFRNNLVYNIAAAKEKQFELEQDVTYLKQAKGLLERYVEEYKALYEPTEQAKAEVAKAEAKIAEIQAKIEQHEATSSAASSAAPADDRAARQEQRRQQKRKYREILTTDPEVAPLYKSSKGMIGGGAAMIGVGALSIFVGLGLLGSAGFSAAIDKEASARRLRIAGWIVFAAGLGLAGGGGALVGLGVKRRRDANLKAKQKAGLAAIAPVFDVASGTFGLAATGRF